MLKINTAPILIIFYGFSFCAMCSGETKKDGHHNSYVLSAVLEAHNVITGSNTLKEHRVIALSVTSISAKD